jgi:membrane fusion protein, multidrug efflux system
MAMRRWIIAAVLVVVVAGAIFWFVRRPKTGTSPTAQQQQQQQRPIPVVTGAVQQRDLPIYLDGLGSVIAAKTVTVRTQVDGRLDSVPFREGQVVRRGDLLAQIDPRPFNVQLHQAEGARDRDAAQLRTARLTLARSQDLLKRKLIAPQDVDNAAATVGQFEGAVRIDQAQIDSAKLNLDYARITSPIDGVTGVRQVDPGNIVHQTDANGIVVLTQLDPIAVLFTLPQDDLSKVAQQMELGTLTVEAWSRDGNTKLATGQLLLIDNQINQNTSTMRLKATFANPQRVLWPNQFVKARLLLSVRKGALVIPATAVQRGPDGTFVYVVGPDETVQNRKIDVDLTQGDIIAIARGLQAGEIVVTDGAASLRPGAKIAARSSGQPQKPAQQPSGRSLGAER